MAVPVEVRPSEVHGRGVFALRDIKKGEFVCVYDGKLLSETDIFEGEFHEDKEYWMQDPTDSTKILCGYKDPKNEVGVGQLVNDAKRVKFDKLNFQDGKKAVIDYDRESKELANVDFKEKFKIYAIRDISKDEELFLHYGYPYWIGFILDKELVYEEQYMWRLLCFCLNGEVVCDGNQILIREALNYSDDSKCRKIIEMMMIPYHVTEIFAQLFDTFVDYLWLLLEGIGIDCIETYLER